MNRRPSGESFGDRGLAGPGLAFAFLLIFALFVTPALATIEVNVTHIGFAAKNGPVDSVGLDIVRQSAWAPIVVDLALTEQQPSFDGWMRVGQRDRDGDECFDQVEVHLRSETGGTQRLFLYIPPVMNRAGSQLGVRLFDNDGNAIKVVSQGETSYFAAPAQPPTSIEDNALVVLEITTTTAGHVQKLVDESQIENNVRRVFAAITEPAGIPELWIGLEMVDCIVWENADPGDLSERQLAAVLEWVRQGGTLLIAASRSAAMLSQTAAIGEVLPADIGAVISVKNLPDVRYELADVTNTSSADEEDEPRKKAVDLDEGFPESVPVVKAKARPGSSVIVHERDIQSDVVTRRSLGRGQVIFSAITVKDLFSAPGAPSTYFRRLLGIARPTETGTSRPQEQGELFGNVERFVAFTTSGTLYFLIAGLFSVLYIALATFGVWTFLTRRRWPQHNWTAFAAVSVVASFLSVLAVSSVRGIGETLHQISVIDVGSGEGVGQGIALFGVKTGIDKQMDVWLPSDPLSEVEPGPARCFLRPLPPSRDLSEQASSFADPQDYRLLPGSAVIDDVRFRATLKQLQGVWSGPVGGTMTGQVELVYDIEMDGDTKRRVYRVMDKSTVTNNLGVDLRDCYLLFSPDNPEGDLRDEGEYGIRAFPLGEIRNGAKLQLSAACYRNATPGKLYEFDGKNSLRTAHAFWGDRFTGLVGSLASGLKANTSVLEGEDHALCLFSTLGDFNFAKHSRMQNSMMGGSITWSRDRMRWLDLRDQLRSDQAVLIGFADAPGPIRLFRREGEREYRKLEPSASKSKTMYRIRLPVTMTERANKGDGADDKG